jgi:hypothetical protein
MDIEDGSAAKERIIREPGISRPLHGICDPEH